MPGHVRSICAPPTKTGAICTTCFLPNVWAVAVYVATDDDIDRVGEIRVCTVCERTQ